MSGIVIICSCLVIFWHPTMTLATVFPHILSSGEDNSPFSFLTVGDWGRKGMFNQCVVANEMGKIGLRMGIHFVISTGDNFYDRGLKSSRDPLFLQSFTRIYTAKSLRVPWLNVLGDHDYMGNVSAQIGRVLPTIDKRWICRRYFMIKRGLADIFFIDTTPFVDDYFIRPNIYTFEFDWEGVMPRRTYTNDVLMKLEYELKKSLATWKIVVGHHPIRTVGEHPDTKELVTRLLPILEKNGVDIYMNGHNHCMEHLTSSTSSIQFFTSGGGSKISGKISQRPRFIPKTKRNIKFYYNNQGFISVSVSKPFVNISIYNGNGRALHSVSLLKKD